jgi:hypothetical protein
MANGEGSHDNTTRFCTSPRRGPSAGWRDILCICSQRRGNALGNGDVRAYTCSGRPPTEEYMQENLYHKLMILHYNLTSSEEREAMEEPIGCRPEPHPHFSLETQIRFLEECLLLDVYLYICIFPTC